GRLGDRRTTLRDARLEDLLDTGQTLGDVVGRGHTTGVERPHRQLGAGLADRLRRDDADGLADVHELAGGQRTAVALGTRAGAGLAGEHGAHPHGLDAGRDQLADLDVAEVVTRSDEQLAGLGVGDVDRRGAGVRRGLDVVVLADQAVLAPNADA